MNRLLLLGTVLCWSTFVSATVLIPLMAKNGQEQRVLILELSRDNLNVSVATINEDANRRTLRFNLILQDLRGGKGQLNDYLTVLERGSASLPYQTYRTAVQEIVKGFARRAATNEKGTRAGQFSRELQLDIDRYNRYAELWQTLNPPSNNPPLETVRNSPLLEIVPIRFRPRPETRIPTNATNAQAADLARQIRIAIEATDRMNQQLITQQGRLMALQSNLLDRINAERRNQQAPGIPTAEDQLMIRTYLETLDQGIASGAYITPSQLSDRFVQAFARARNQTPQANSDGALYGEVLLQAVRQIGRGSNNP